jgi:uncharacterized protein involved in exopolysaccharide biosynthesis
LGREHIYKPEVGDGVGHPVADVREQLQVAEACVLASRELQERVLQVSFTHKDPQRAAQVLSALIDAYLAKRL